MVPVGSPSSPFLEESPYSLEENGNRSMLQTNQN